MKKLLLLAAVLFSALLSASETMKVLLTTGNTLYMRSSWSATHDLFRVCGLGGNKQFNYTYSAIVDKKTSDTDLMIKGKYPGRFHWCGDSVGVMHLYPDANKRTVYILSGNHGYSGSEITQAGHGYTAADIGKKLGEKFRICAVLSKDKFRVVPSGKQTDFPKAQKVTSFSNFQATRTLSRTYLLDGKEIPRGKILSGKELTVLEKTATCVFEALMAVGLDHKKVNDFYTVHDYAYNFYPNGACRVENKVTFMRDVLLMGVSSMQDSDMELGKTYDFYEKYIPKVKKFALPENTPWQNTQVRIFDGKKYRTDSRTYDFENIQDMTEKRKGDAKLNPRFEIAVKGGFVDPADLPDRWIEFVGKTENGKKVRKVGNVLGLDSESGVLRSSERAKNKLAFIIPSWTKMYPTHFSPGKKVVAKGTTLEMNGYRCYFNPENIGDATVLFTIPGKKGFKVYADFHKSVKDYVLPFAPGAKYRIVEKTPSVTLKGNKVSVAGSYGRIVVAVE